MRVTLGDISEKYTWLRPSKRFKTLSVYGNCEFEAYVCKDNEKNPDIFFHVINFWDVEDFSPEAYDNIASMNKIILSNNNFSCSNRTKLLFFLSILDNQNPINSIVSQGYFDMAVWAIKNGFPKSMSAFHIATSNGYIDIMNLLHKNSFPDDDIFNTAIKSGKMSSIQWLLDHSYSWNSFSCGHAAETGNLTLLKWLRSHGCSPSDESANLAVKGGNVQILKWMKEDGFYFGKESLYNAFKYGHLEVVKWLLEFGLYLYENNLKKAIENGHIHILNWVYENCFDVDFDPCLTNYAAASGQIKVLEWFLSKGIEFTSITRTCAIDEDQLETLIWLERVGDLENDEYLCNNAAAKGNLRILKFLCENGYYYDEITCAEAASNLECLKYLRELGCPWDIKTTQNAIELGNLDSLKYAIENGCPCSGFTYRQSCRYIEIMIYLHQSGFPFTDMECGNSVYYRNVETLKYAHEHGCSWNRSITYYACLHRFYGCFIYAIQNGCDWDREKCSDILKKRGDHEIIQLIDRY